MLSATERMSESAGSLVDHLDAGTLHVARVAAQRHGPPLHLHRAALRTERPGGNVHECRLSGPVVPQQPDDLARANLECHIGERHIAAKGDVHIGHMEERRPRHRFSLGGDGSARCWPHGSAANTSARRSEARSVPHIADVEVLRGLRRDEFRIDEDVLERLAFPPPPRGSSHSQWRGSHYGKRRPSDKCCSAAGSGRGLRWSRPCRRGSSSDRRSPRLHRSTPCRPPSYCRSSKRAKWLCPDAP